MHLRNTKIIATFGPATKKRETFLKLIDAGVDVVRFNFSHLTPQKAEEDYLWIEKIAKTKKKLITFLADLKGPEIRIGEEEFNLKNQEKIAFYYHDPTSPKTISNKNISKTSLKMISIDHPFLDKIIPVNQIITADDGNFKFKVIEIKDKKIICKVLIGGVLKPRKSLNLSKFDLQLPILSKSDQENLKFIAKKKFSWIAASFVSRAEEILAIKKKLKSLKVDIPIISKIETSLGVKNIDEIIDVSEGIMVARGDLGQDFSYEEIPRLQDLIVKKTKEKGKVCIIATQLLNGMIENPIPTRSEVTDINLATKNKVDAVMLSGETASGKYPIKAVKVMKRVIEKTEKNLYESDQHELFDYQHTNHLFYYLCHSALNLVRHSDSKCLLIITEKGRGPIYISAFRPWVLTFVTTKRMDIFLRCRLYYSIHPIYLKHNGDHISYLKKSVDDLKKKKILHRKNKIVSIYSERFANHRIEHITQQEVI